MAKYRNTADTRSFEYSEPFISISRDEGTPFNTSFRAKDEDLPLIACDLLKPVKGSQPGNMIDPESKADLGQSDEVLIYVAWRNLEAVRIRRERAAKEDEKSEQRKQLEADAVKYMNAVLQNDFIKFSNDTARDYWVDELVFSRKQPRGTA